MEILNDIIKAIEKQRIVVETLSKEVSALKAQVNNPKPINLDSEKIAKHLLPHIDTSLQGIQSKTQELTKVVNQIPKEVNSRKIHGITANTMTWLSIVFFSLLSGFWIAPKAMQNVEYKVTKFQLERREQQIQEFRNKNPKSADKYFGF